MQFQFNDGGRADAGFRGSANDCTVRSISIATGLPYQKVYDDLFALNRQNNKNPAKCSPRDRGTSMQTVKKYMANLGWKWHATMGIGTGCSTHLRAEELPKGNLVVRVSKHLVAVVNGVINDTYDCSREGTRCVYGYFARS